MKMFNIISKSNVKVIDLFCGIGGMTHGFIRQGFNVSAGIDIDETCRYSYENNNGSIFLHKDIRDVTGSDLQKLYGKAKVKILIGCAPCQPFSSLNLSRSVYKKTDRRWNALKKFIELINDVKPDIVSMENVKDLHDGEKFPIFREFLDILEKNNYHVFYKIVDASRYGVPQRRKRLVLLASRLGPIQLIAETHSDKELITVRQVISHLPRIKDGHASRRDPIHWSSRLSEMNRLRIKATSKDGGSAKDWKKSLVLKCHKTSKGKSYKSTVYGRMRWDEPSPTMTTHCTTLGTGRFGHPSQDRAISLREASLFQSFPKNYRFTEPGKPVLMTKMARHIGNAVPVRLGEVIAKSIKIHLATV